MLNHILLIFLVILSALNLELLATTPQKSVEFKCNIEKTKKSYINSNPESTMKLPTRNQLSSRLKKEFQQSTEMLWISKNRYFTNLNIRYLNYPVEYWNNVQNKISKNPENCVKFPAPADVSFVNSLWQEFISTDGTFRMFNSYLDNRKLAKKPKIRILAMVNRRNITVKLFCNIWFQNSSHPVVSPVSEWIFIGRDAWITVRDDMYYLHLLSCIVPKSYQNSIPIAVTLSEKSCKKSRNVLKVIYEKPAKKKSFAICVKGLDFPDWDFSLQLVEWLEMTKLLGVDKVYIYEYGVHPNMKKVLNYYSYSGYIEVIPLTYSKGKPYLLHVADQYKWMVKEFEEAAAQNDCWNRNIHKYDFISILDTDEMIIPAKSFTWKELIDQIEAIDRKGDRRRRNSYVAREARFSLTMLTTPEIPSYLTLTRRVLRIPYSRIGWYPKSIHKTRNILTVHTHYYFASLDGKGISEEMDPSLVQLNHYKNCNIDGIATNCPILDATNATVDTNLWKYFPKLNIRVAHALKEIDCFAVIGV